MPRSQAADPNAHLYGKIDPSDGIPFRKAGPVDVERGGQGPLPPFKWRYISMKRRLFRVRIKAKGTLRHIGYFRNLREAQDARDRYFAMIYGQNWRDRLR